MDCHGREPLMANLDLRTRDGALKGAKHGPVIVPGNAAASHLYRRLIGAGDAADAVGRTADRCRNRNRQGVDR